MAQRKRNLFILLGVRQWQILIQMTVQLMQEQSTNKHRRVRTKNPRSVHFVSGIFGCCSSFHVFHLAACVFKPSNRLDDLTFFFVSGAGREAHSFASWFMRNFVINEFSVFLCSLAGREHSFSRRYIYATERNCGVRLCRCISRRQWVEKFVRQYEWISDNCHPSESAPISINANTWNAFRKRSTNLNCQEQWC